MDVPDDVIEACKRGEPEAFEELVRLTHQGVFSLAYRLVGNREDAADVAQDTYIKLLRAIKTFRGDAKFSTWLYRVTSSVAISHLRKNSKHRADLSLDAESVRELPSLADPGRDAEQSELKSILDKALASLPVGYRAVVVMKDVYGFSLAEAGNQLGITEGAAKVRLFRARQRLKEMLYDEAPKMGARTRKRKRGVS